MGEAATRENLQRSGLVARPIGPAIVRLAAPTTGIVLVQAVVTFAELHFVGRLGHESLAAVAVVYPLILLMTGISAGALGGGTSSAISRAIGAGLYEEAGALIYHALALAIVGGAFFSALVLALGPSLYAALGADGAARDAALRYSSVLFIGAVFIWCFNVLAAAFRGCGDAAGPAIAGGAGALAGLALFPLLIFGAGPVPALGIDGAALALVLDFALATALLIAMLLRGRLPIELAFRRPDLALFLKILSVGLPSAANSIVTSLTTLLLTGAVGPFGTAAIAGYGIGARLELFMIPLVFALGSALVPLVGASLGAGLPSRAKQITWFGASIAAAVTASIGLVSAVYPDAWLQLFTAEPSVLATGKSYLRCVAPFYGFFGLGIALWFASQGAGRVVLALGAGVIRLAVVALGAVAVAWQLGTIESLFDIMALGLVCFGVSLALLVKYARWS